MEGMEIVQNLRYSSRCRTRRRAQDAFWQVVLSQTSQGCLQGTGLKVRTLLNIASPAASQTSAWP